MAGQHFGQRALAAAVPTHHGVNFPSPHLQIHTLENRLLLNRGMEVIDVEKQLGVGADHNRKGKSKERGSRSGLSPRIPRA